jgi:hypothetical protein
LKHAIRNQGISTLLITPLTRIASDWPSRVFRGVKSHCLGGDDLALDDVVEHRALVPYQSRVPGPPLNGPTRSLVIQPP